MPDKYRRDQDNIDAILADTREAHGKLGALIDTLSRVVTDLRTETGSNPQPQKEVRDGPG